MDVTNPSSFGTTVFDESETIATSSPHDAQQSITVTRAQGEWRPPERLAEFLPEGFTVQLECWTERDGIRRIIPRCSFEELVDVGAVGGLAVIHGIRDFNAQVDFSYRVMQLIHQHVRGRAYRGTRGMKEHLTRDFNYSRDLYVRRSGRFSDDERNVLPDDVGLNVDGHGRCLSVTQLTELGRRAAQEAGYRNPTSSQAIAFGLFEAAKMNPLEVESEGVPALVRMALFDIDTGEDAPSEELIEIVTERLLEAIHGHLDDSQTEFDRWFVGPNNSLVKQIAQQKTKRGGKLDREDVRQALLHIGWRAYQYVGQCVHALMRTINNSLPDPLSDEERQLFEGMYESQPYYGNLPLALLAERSHAIKLAVLAIWNEPDNRNHVRVLHRLLAYYADMARKRRPADRRTKRKRQSGPSTTSQCASTIDRVCNEDTGALAEDVDPTGHYAGSVQLIENLHRPPSSEEAPFAKIADHIRELRAVECEAGCGQWEYQCVGQSQNSITIAIRCACGSVEKNIDIPHDQFVAYAEQVLQWEKRPPDGLTTDADMPSGES